MIRLGRIHLRQQGVGHFRRPFDMALGSLALARGQDFGAGQEDAGHILIRLDAVGVARVFGQGRLDIGQTGADQRFIHAQDRRGVLRCGGAGGQDQDGGGHRQTFEHDFLLASGASHRSHLPIMSDIRALSN